MIKELRAAYARLTSRAHGIRSPDPAVDPGAADGVRSALPYEETLRAAEEEGTVLKRHHIYGSGPPVKEANRLLVDYVVERAGTRVLDVGCGAGAYVTALADRGYTAVGVDLALASLRLAQDQSLRLAAMDARSLAFADGAFDTCVLFEVIEHVDEFEELLKEAGRVAQKNILISVPNIAVIPPLFPYSVVPWHLLEATHVNFFTPRSLEVILKRAFPGAQRVQVEEYARAFPWADRELYYGIRAEVLLRSDD